MTAVGALVSSALDIPKAFLDAKAAAIRTKTDLELAKTKLDLEFLAGALKVATKEGGADEAKRARAYAYFAERQFREQTTREDVAAEAIRAIRDNPPDTDAEREVDEDWLHLFARAAETKTSAEVKTYFARVLAGEIRKPGTFSPETIDVLSKLTPNMALLFQTMCNITTYTGNVAFVLFGPLDEFSGNRFSSFGLTFYQLTRLSDLGLVRDGAVAMKEAPEFLTGVLVGGASLGLATPAEGPDGAPPRWKQRRNLAALQLTQAGTELLQIVHATPNPAYVELLRAWAVEQLGLVRTAADA